MFNSKFLIFTCGSSNTKNFVYEINHNAIYTTENYLDALYVDTKEHAFAIAEYCHSRNSKVEYNVLEIKTTMEVVENN